MAHTIKKMNLKKVKLITIDTFNNQALSEKRLSRREANSIYSEVKNRLESEFDFVEVVKSGTGRAAEKYSDLKIDFLFIDADHSYEGVKADFEAWSPKVKEDGIIAFHDSNFEPVKQFQSEIEDWVMFDSLENLTVWRRKITSA